MATNYTNISKSIHRELSSYGYQFREHKHNIGFIFKMSLKAPSLSVSSSSKRRRELMVICSSFTSTSSKNEADLDENRGDDEGQFTYFAEEYGWTVRRLVEDESGIKKVAYIQTQAFYEPMRFFNSFFFGNFEAEVLAALLYRLRNSPPNRYACLVADPNTEATESHSSEIVGVVDVTAMRDDKVLRYLPEAQEYLYVSGIAVLSNCRRRKVATALLKACEILSNAWGFEYLALRAYEDDMGPLKLYSNAGYKVVSGDPLWMTTWIGRRRRVLMIKQPKIYQHEIPRRTQP